MVDLPQRMVTSPLADDASVLSGMMVDLSVLESDVNDDESSIMITLPPAPPFL